MIQLHGDESPDDVAAMGRATGLAVWKVIAASGPGDLAHFDAWPVEVILLDAPAAGRGGAGKTFDWTLARDARRQSPELKLVLAGGLARIIHALRAPGSGSGLEHVGERQMRRRSR